MKLTPSRDASNIWLLPPPDLKLSVSEIHIWRAELEQPEPVMEQLLCLLSEDERMRAKHFRFRPDRDHFVVARGALRMILGHYLSREPRSLLFSYGRYGKPFITSVAEEDRLYFNLSHSRSLALFGFTRDGELGVDIEYVREGFSIEEIAKTFFAGSEAATLSAISPRSKAEAFFNCWTRKEAYIKARGEGLFHPLHQFIVTLSPGEPARLLSAEGEELEASGWRLFEIKPGVGYAAALAIQKRNQQLKRFECQFSSSNEGVYLLPFRDH